MDEIEKWKKRFERERFARKEAEKLLETKSEELYNLNLKLEDQNKHLETVQHIARMASWCYDLKTKKITFSEEIYDILELDQNDEKLKLVDFFSYIHPEDRDHIKNFYDNLLFSTDKRFIEYRLLMNDGRIKWVHEDYKTKFDENNNPISSIGTIHDITESKILNLTLMEKEKEISTILEGARAISWTADIKTMSIKYNENSFFDYDTKDLNSLTDYIDIIHPEDMSAVQKAYQSIIEGATKVTTQLRVRRKDRSSYRWLESRMVEGERKNGQLLSIMGITYDISEDIKNKSIIKEQRKEFETIFNYAQDGIAIVDLETNILNCNEAFVNMTGYTKSELLTKTCTELTIFEDREMNYNAIQHAILFGKHENIEKSCIKKDGQKVIVNMGVSLLPDKTKLLLTVKDITALKVLEEQSKLAYMGEMIGNIAHQWRQPLSIITTCASGVKLNLELDMEINKELMISQNDKILEQAQYLSKTIDDFRSFIKDDKQFKNIHLSEVIQSTISLVDSSLKSNYIKLITNIDDDIEIKANKNELQQALINILNNAKDAIKEFVKDDKDRYILIETKKINEHTLSLEICDSGGGMPEEIVPRVFEPYFTTKHKSIGTGLGLSMVDKIMRERHNFTVKAYNKNTLFDNKHYKGACFNIVFTNKTLYIKP